MTEQQQQKHTIILLGGSEHIFYLLKHAIGADSYEIENIATSEKCVKQIHDIQPDLILVSEEVELPEAFKYSRQLRDVFCDNPVPVIIALRRADTETVFNAFESGATDYVRAPVRWDLLRHKIQRCIEERGQLKTAIQQSAEMVFDMAWKLHTLSGAERAFLLIATLHDNQGKRLTNSELLLIKSGLLASSHGAIQTVPVEDYLITYSDRDSHIRHPEVLFNYITENVDIVSGFRVHAAGLEIHDDQSFDAQSIQRTLALIMQPAESSHSTFIRVPVVMDLQIGA